MRSIALTAYARMTTSQTFEPQQIFVDHQGAIQPAKNPKFHERTKHIGVRYHFDRNVSFPRTYLPRLDMTADIMTKNLSRETDWRHVMGLDWYDHMGLECFRGSRGGARMALGSMN